MGCVKSKPVENREKFETFVDRNRSYSRPDDEGFAEKRSRTQTLDRTLTKMDVKRYEPN